MVRTRLNKPEDKEPVSPSAEAPETMESAPEVTPEAEPAPEVTPEAETTPEAPAPEAAPEPEVTPEGKKDRTKYPEIQANGKFQSVAVGKGFVVYNPMAIRVSGVIEQKEADDFVLRNNIAGGYK